ncbi:hypothetical protein [Prochlorococcus sp. MIT 1341]|uniref:hypothetical protein n=1 Tax=Prochlorococcus sp. MIT 1341 TaxID=3096221 RepID=UPI002A75269C|nr:hypothetical protein [Prochlorococcus sp. MIT 1341]
MSEPDVVYVLIAPVGQLSANGQLRETVKERRNRQGDDVAFWYLSPELVKQFQLSVKDVEGVVATELTAINWLKLRLGGECFNAQLDIEKLRALATELPPPPITRDIACK